MFTAQHNPFTGQLGSRPSAGEGAQRLAGQVLRYEGFSSIDPSHPLGGPDGLKDLICMKGTQRWIGAAYFPRGEQTKTEVKKKIAHDAEGIQKNKAVGLAFVTNQEITLADRQEFADLMAPGMLELLHLERIASILDAPPCYMTEPVVSHPLTTRRRGRRASRLTLWPPSPCIVPSVRASSH